MYEKFGKSFKDILELKQSFFTENGPLMEKTMRYAELYTAQPRRLNCKICAALLPKNFDFTKHGVPYVQCTTCTHLNGWHEDSDAFCEQVYTSDSGKEYAQAYSAIDVDAYYKRRDAIHKPKAEFLIEALRKLGEQVDDLRFADMGAGAGYFVSALQSLGYPATKGYEVSKAQVDLANFVLDPEAIKLTELHQTVELCSQLDVDVMTFIGVFEHVQNPRAILESMRKNSSVRYFYFCVPMFSSTIFGEMAFPDIMPRQLAIAHTHLFTRASIEHFGEEFGLSPVAAWWFGTDMMDYYRSVAVTLQANPDTAKMGDAWGQEFQPILDDMQLAIDKQRRSSQVHMLMRFDD